MKAEILPSGYRADRTCEHCDWPIINDRCNCGDNVDRYRLTMLDYQRNMNFESQWLEVAATKHLERRTPETAAELKRSLEEWLWARRRSRGG